MSSYVMYEVIDLYGSLRRFNKLLAMRGSFKVESSLFFSLVAPHEYPSSVQAAELNEIKAQQDERRIGASNRPASDICFLICLFVNQKVGSDAGQKRRWMINGSIMIFYLLPGI